MDTLPASAGWQWVRDGFTLLRRQPAELCTLFLSYLFLMLALSFIPVAGQLLPLLLIPVFSMAFMQACVLVEKRKRVLPSLLLYGFRSKAFGNLVKLGALYVLAAALAIGVSVLIDGGALLDIMTGSGKVDPENMPGLRLPLAMLAAATIYTPAAMAFWYAAPLVTWQEMGIFKALFYSFFAVLRAKGAFLIYGLGWMLMGVMLPLLFSSVLGAVTQSTSLMMIVLIPLSVILTVAMYCSFYATYVAFFPRPESA
ncbi:BPSS1780 family membrane protein [Noviherbaspirillum pedocola]|uniref:Transmembrane protein n=1 Tax=Noviherbaspirillum pedocola TaxID=2801341 RepID=A0A934SVH8_9BURK|nr:BPSS1780 family membrane protein [Noviherbaspirillum pedocola]MBK4736522.1 hypothetical protein [Noviherbaspirillum pedocola]